MSTRSASAVQDSYELTHRDSAVQLETSREHNLEELQEDIAVHGDYQPYLALLGAWCAHFTSGGMLNSYGALQAWLSTHELKNLNNTQIAWIFSIYVFLFAFGGVVVGPTFDAYGLRPLLIPGSLGAVTALMVLSVSTTYYQFILGFSIIGGISASILFTTSLATIGQWFTGHRSIATALATTAGPIGGIVFPIMFQKLAPTIGFGWTLRIFGFLSFLLTSIAILLMRTRVLPTRQLRWKTNFSAFREPRYTMTVLGMFALESAVLIPPTYLTSYCLAYGIPYSLSYNLLAYLNAASIVGRILPGFLSDRYGHFNVMVLSSLPCAIVTLALWLKASNTAAIVAFAILFGLFSGTTHSLTPVCIAQLSGRQDFATRFGTAYIVISSAYLISLPLGGALLRNVHGKQDFSALIWFSGVVYLAGSLAFTSARVLGTGFKVWRIY